jgi:hypothetical protein
VKAASKIRLQRELKVQSAKDKQTLDESIYTRKKKLSPLKASPKLILKD